MKRHPLPDPEYVRSVVNYDPETGLFTNAVNRNPAAPKGKESGCDAPCGGGKVYRVIRFHKKLFLAHRIAWLLVHGVDPGDLDIDHINGNGLDNRISNLRAITHQQNLYNSRRPTTNTSGHKGVSKNKGAWMAYLRVGGKLKVLGRSKVFDEAVAIYQQAAREIRGEFARIE